MNNAALYRLMTWFSPSYPIGSFHYSHGIEYAVEGGFINDGQSLREWIKAILCFGSGRIDGIFFKEAYGLFKNPSHTFLKRLDKLISLSNALKGAPELWDESSKQGASALRALLKTHSSQRLELLDTFLKKIDKRPTLAIVYGAVCAENAIPLEAALTAYFHAFSMNLITAGIKLLPLGQTEGQAIAAALEVVIQKSTDHIIHSKIGNIGGSAPMVEWTSVQHEDQYTRLFQS